MTKHEENPWTLGERKIYLENRIASLKEMQKQNPDYDKSLKFLEKAIDVCVGKEEGKENGNS